MKHLAAALGPLLILNVIPGCTADPTGPTFDLRIEVRRGPLSPVEIEGQDNSAPVERAVVRIRADGDEKARGRSDSMGIASFSLPAADYVIEVLECPLALGLPGPTDVHLGPGPVVSQTLFCDTGIR